MQEMVHPHNVQISEEEQKMAFAFQDQKAEDEGNMDNLL